MGLDYSLESSDAAARRCWPPTPRVVPIRTAVCRECRGGATLRATDVCRCMHGLIDITRTSPRATPTKPRRDICVRLPDHRNRCEVRCARPPNAVLLCTMASWTAMHSMPGMSSADQQPRSCHMPRLNLPARPHPARSCRTLTSACCPSHQRPDHDGASTSISAASPTSRSLPEPAEEHAPVDARQVSCSTALARVAIAVAAVSGAAPCDSSFSAGLTCRTAGSKRRPGWTILADISKVVYRGMLAFVLSASRTFEPSGLGKQGPQLTLMPLPACRLVLRARQGGRRGWRNRHRSGHAGRRPGIRAGSSGGGLGDLRGRGGVRRCLRARRLGVYKTHRARLTPTHAVVRMAVSHPRPCHVDDSSATQSLQ